MLSPTPRTITADDLGYFEVQWADGDGSGLDTTTFDAGDVLITGVTIDRIEDLGSGVVRYHYADDNEQLDPGVVEVTLVAGQVRDVAGSLASTPPMDELVLNFSLADQDVWLDSSPNHCPPLGRPRPSPLT